MLLAHVKLAQLYVESGSCRKHIFEEFSKRVFTSIAMCLTFALAGLDVLSRHLSYPSRAAAAGRSRVITGYFGFTISSANLFFNLSLYTALCCLCILLYLKVSALVFNSRQQVVLQPMDVTEPDAAQRKSEAITAQVEAVMDLPFLLFFGCLNGPLKTISLFSLLLASLASIFSFVFPTLWQLFFWTVAIVVVFVASTAVTGALSSPAAGPTRDLGA